MKIINLKERAEQMAEKKLIDKIKKDGCIDSMKELFTYHLFFIATSLAPYEGKLFVDDNALPFMRSVFSMAIEFYDTDGDMTFKEYLTFVIDSLAEVMDV